MTVDTCVLCSKDVTEDDHRREIDCPNKHCPGRVYHEECIAAYLKKTKYSKDRCTYFPTNQKKRQARLEAAVGAAAITAAAARTRPVAAVKPPKAPSAAQVAIAAIKRAAPE
ncbi:hypothetical protein TSOC_012737, partial [Tetrabaena socialis]